MMGTSTAPTESPAVVDARGRFRMRAELPLSTIGFYLLLIALLAYADSRTPTGGFPLLATFLVAVILLFLARFLTTMYSLDGEHLRARRLFGSRRIRLEDIRKIEYANLRELGGVSFFGGWGWRGRLWSSTIGSFDSISTASRGLLVSEGRVPIFISPLNTDAFARELSRRVRSYHPDLEVDVGAS
jgi:Bacterial PH domain